MEGSHQRKVASLEPRLLLFVVSVGPGTCRSERIESRALNSSSTPGALLCCRLLCSVMLSIARCRRLLGCAIFLTGPKHLL